MPNSREHGSQPHERIPPQADSRPGTARSGRPERPHARYDDLSYYTRTADALPTQRVPDRRPHWLRWLPTSFATSEPLAGKHMARIKMAAYH